MKPTFLDNIKKGKSPRIEAYLKKYYGNTLDIKKKNRDYVKKFEKINNNNQDSKKKIKRKKKVFSNADRNFSYLKQRKKSKSQKNVKIKNKVDKNILKNKTIKKRIHNKSSQVIKSKKLDHLKQNFKIAKKKKIKNTKTEEENLKKKINQELIFSWNQDIEKEIKKFKIQKNITPKILNNQEKEYLKIGETIKNLNITEMENAQYFTFDNKFSKNTKIQSLKKKNKIKNENYNSKNFFILLQKNNNNSHSPESYKQIFKNSISNKSSKNQKINNFQKLLLNPSNISSSKNPSIDLKITDSIRIESNLLKTEKKFTNESSSMGLSETIGKIKYTEDNLKKKYKGNKIFKEEDLIKGKITYDSFVVNSDNLFRVPEKINSERNINILNFLNSTNKKNQKFFSTYDPVKSEKDVGKEFKRFYNIKSNKKKKLTKKESKDYFALIFKNNYKLLNSNTPHQLINSEEENEDEKIMQKFTKDPLTINSEFTSSNEIKKNSKDSVNKFSTKNSKMNSLNKYDRKNNKKDSFYKFDLKNSKIESHNKFDLKSSKIESNNRFELKSSKIESNNRFDLKNSKMESNNKFDLKNSKIKSNTKFDLKNSNIESHNRFDRRNSKIDSLSKFDIKNSNLESFSKFDLRNIESVKKFDISNTKIIEESESQSEIENVNNENIFVEKEFSKKLDLIIFWMIDRKVKIIQRAWKNFLKKKEKMFFFKIDKFWKEFLKKKKNKSSKLKGMNFSSKEIKKDFYKFLKSKEKLTTKKILFEKIFDRFDYGIDQILSNY